MRKEIFLHSFSLVIFITAVTVLRGLLPNSVETLLAVAPLWIGAVLGTILPDLDHLIYVYFLKPQELTSQRVEHMTQNQDIKGAVTLLSATTQERTQLIFHTTMFQVIFLVLTFLVMSSSSSLLGRGLVLAFSLHLVVDQWVDIKRAGNLNNWFRNFPLVLNLSQQKWYLGVLGVLLLAFALLF